MTQSHKVQALIIGSFMVNLISLLDKKNLTKKSSIDLWQWLARDIPIKKEFAIEPYADMANQAWEDGFKDFNNVSLSHGIIVETLYANHVDMLNSFYGEEIRHRVARFSHKQQARADISNYAKDSYRCSQALTDAVRKQTFEYLKDK